MTRSEILDLVGKTAREAQIRDDVCSRSTLIGLKAAFPDLPDDLIRASLSLCGGAGGSSGSCGTYTCGLLAVGWKFNVPLEEELADPSRQQVSVEKFQKFREYYLQEMGTTLCPEFQKKLYGRSFDFKDPKDCEEYWKIKDHNIRCAEIVEKAARVTAAFILDEEKQAQ